LPVEEQIKLLQSRGMHIEDFEEAAHFLSTVNYYRFCGYALHYEIFQNRTRTHQYKAGTTFRQVVYLHEFDSKFRTLLFSCIEHIEIAFRTAICLELSLRYKNGHWYLDKALYDPNRFKYDEFIADCRKEFNRSREVFSTAYKENYSKPELPPCWMLSEILSIGKWSKLFSGLRDHSDQKLIAKHFRCHPYHLQSWMHGLSFLRNLCAHHSHIWNKTFPILVHLTDRQKQSVYNPEKIAPFCTVMANLLSTLGRKDAFKSQLVDLLDKFPLVPIEKMGFALGWKESPIWK
jgi:abortive infection bacteriophage resistance protein